jgi:branched-chain amino acid transport system permease protein
MMCKQSSIIWVQHNRQGFRMTAFLKDARKNPILWITLVVFLILFIMAVRGLQTRDWVITLLRSLSVGSLTFLVASGFSLIFGLLDVLNLAHGTLFMIGAYVGWTIYVRPDTFIDLLTPATLLAAGFALMPAFYGLAGRLTMNKLVGRIWPWVGLPLAAVLLAFSLPKYPVTAWDAAVYNQSPASIAFQAEQSQLVLPPPALFKGISPVVDLLAILVGSSLAALSFVGFSRARNPALIQKFVRPGLTLRTMNRAYFYFVSLLIFGVVVFLVNTPLTNAIDNLNTSWKFLIAAICATLFGIILGGLMEAVLIRPLYARPIYQLMLTLGLSAIGIELVRAIWGRPEFTMPTPALFNNSGQGCPAENLLQALQRQCSTISVLGGRVRTYNEIFIPLVGLVVLVSVWLLLQRTRIGMTIRAGVQDREMVEALGINVRRIFTLVFALGAGLAVLGGVLAGPSMGLSSGMGDSLLLNALIALAIGGLTSYPGAAAGSLLVGLLQQFIIKYGQVGIHLPFLAAPFKPTPPLVPASTVLLMVIILLIMPQGLFGRRE